MGELLMVFELDLVWLWIGLIGGTSLFLPLYIKAWRKSEMDVKVKIIYGILMTCAGAVLIFSWHFGLSIGLPLLFYVIFEALCIVIMYTHLTERLEPYKFNFSSAPAYIFGLISLIISIAYFFIIEALLQSNYSLSLNELTYFTLFFLEVIPFGLISTIRIGKNSDAFETGCELQTGPRLWISIILLIISFINICVGIVFIRLFYIDLNPKIYETLPLFIVSPITHLILALLHLLIGIIVAIPSLILIIKEQKKRKQFRWYAHASENEGGYI